MNDDARSCRESFESIEKQREELITKCRKLEAQNMRYREIIKELARALYLEGNEEV